MTKVAARTGTHSSEDLSFFVSRQNLFLSSGKIPFPTMSSLYDDAELSLPPMPVLSITSKTTIDKCRNFPLLETDIFICSYPKSGTTWLQHVTLTLILLHNHQINKKNTEEFSADEPLLLLSIPSLPTADSPPVYQHVSDYAPFFDIDAHWDNDNPESQNVGWIRDNQSRIGRRIYNTHLRFDMLPSSRKFENRTAIGNSSKLIYIVRTPLDTCTSFYAHLSNQVEGGYEKGLEEFCAEWMNGNIAYGSWDDHVLSYMMAFSQGTRRKVTLDDGRQIFLILYEEMVDNLSNVVDELVDFLQLDIGSHPTNDLLRLFSFEYMRRHIDHFQPKSVTWKNQFKFLRGGRTGDGQRTISADEQAEYDRFRAERNIQNRLSQVLTTNQTNSEVYGMICSYFASADSCAT